MNERTAKAMRPNKLPLLGSNQDSPDPESGSDRATRSANAVTPAPTLGIPSENVTEFHEKSHDQKPPCPFCHGTGYTEGRFDGDLVDRKTNPLGRIRCWLCRGEKR